MILKSFKFIMILLLFSGCVKQPPEIVTDLVYVKNQCPTFNHKLNFEAVKYIPEKEYTKNYVILEIDHFLASLERNKEIRVRFNEMVDKSNKNITISGEPRTKNFIRKEKKIFTFRECPTFEFKPKFEAQKFDIQKKYTDNEYLLIDLDHFLKQLSLNKLSRETFNNKVKKFNKSFQNN